MIRLTYEQIEVLFKEHLNGTPVYKLAKKVGVSDRTLGRKFKKFFNYTQHKNNYLTSSIQHYLKSPAFSKHREEIQQWYEQHQHLIIRDGQTTNRPAYDDFYLEQKLLVENRRMISASLLSKQDLYASRHDTDEELLYQLSRLS
ncbi:hypothetical protein [Anabaena sp. CCY 9402-a]|uniref:hypothetical protein n=1 Tax=Anabaena sp. CCY 9402-a TaxID=3103867 RepID=UPI0039C64AE3